MVLKDRIEKSLSFSIESNCVTLYIYIIPSHEGFSKLARAFLRGFRTLPCPGGTCIPIAQFPAIYQGVGISKKKKVRENRE